MTIRQTDFLGSKAILDCSFSFITFGTYRYPNRNATVGDPYAVFSKPYLIRFTVDIFHDFVFVLI